MAWARASQNPVNVGRSRPHLLELIDPIGHQAATLGIEAEGIDRRQAEASGQVMIRSRRVAVSALGVTMRPPPYRPKADSARSMSAALRTSADDTERPN